MFVVLAATNRPGSNTLKVARLMHEKMQAQAPETVLLNLQELPPAIYGPSAYAVKPPEFEAFQQPILEAEGMLVVTPEYNGSFPGILKYFIDMLKFPESLLELPVAMVGLAAGMWGALRSTEQLTQILQYRNAHVYGKRVLMPQINSLLDAEGRLIDRKIEDRLDELVQGFVPFARAVRAAGK